MFGISAGAALAIGVGGAALVGSMGADAPDNSGMNDAARQQASLSKEQLDWSKQIYAETAPDRADAIRRANLVSDAQLSSMGTQTALAKDYADYNKTTFRPLEQGIVTDAVGYDTEARRDAAAGKATADVEMSLSAQRGIAARNQQRMGVNPASGQALALENQMSIAGASMKAKAASDARTQIETVGQARKMDAANLGRGLASSQATSAGLALTAGNNSAANGQASGNITAQGNGIMTTGFAGAQQGLAGAANTYGNIASLQSKSSDSGLAGMLGSVAGQYAGSAAGSAQIATMFSDKNMKKDRKPVSGKASMAALRKVPVESWKYKRGSAGDDGGRTHTGPMAQAVQKGLGDATAPGGKKIDLISMNGHTIGAVKELDKRLMRLENARPKSKAAR